ncbi:hypothetical protein K8I61_10145 [bacterium]|nr:hypothetical protein [bacterium]
MREGDALAAFSVADGWFGCRSAVRGAFEAEVVTVEDILAAWSIVKPFCVVAVVAIIVGIVAHLLSLVRTRRRDVFDVSRVELSSGWIVLAAIGALFVCLVLAGGIFMLY